MDFNLYSNKQRWKIFLATGAMLIVFFSLLYTDKLVRKIAEEERQKVELWADAIQNRAKLLTYTESLFKSLAEEERSRVEIWADATRLLAGTEDEKTINFCLKVITSNNNIPVIIVDKSGAINASINIDSTRYTQYSKFEGALRDDFSRRPPIVFDDNFGNQYSIRYMDSRLTEELKYNLNLLVESFLSEVINSASVPVLVTDSLEQTVIASGNIDTSKIKDKTYLKSLVSDMEAQNTHIDVYIAERGSAKIFYKDSYILQQLRYYPYIQFGVIGLFIIVGYMMFSFSRRAEQNMVWVGMAKETAHQLGTPLSSLIAWIEYFRLKDIDSEIVNEMEKDVKRLETITDRFSKIGAAPKLDPEDISMVLTDAIDYMKARVSSKVQFNMHFNTPPGTQALLNKPLFEWVIENLTRNAIDAMDGTGSITVEVRDSMHQITIDITDTGKGMPKSMFKAIFEPGYTSKRRGWGIGLSLSKRIMEEYHKGKIAVKRSEVGKGTTFRLILNKAA